MNKEEKEAIEYLKKEYDFSVITQKTEAFKCILNLINKQQKENEEQFRKLCNLSIKLDMETISKDKIREKIKEIEKNEPYNTGFDYAQLATYRELLEE